MSPLIVTALISLFVASLSGFISSYIAISVERRKLKIDLKKAYSIELFKKRLEAYPPIWAMLGGLSAQAIEPLNPAKAGEIAHHLNDWLYSVGGLYADRAVAEQCWMFAMHVWIWMEKRLLLKKYVSFEMWR